MALLRIEKGIFKALHEKYYQLIKGVADNPRGGTHIRVFVQSSPLEYHLRITFLLTHQTQKNMIVIRIWTAVQKIQIAYRTKSSIYTK